MPGIDPIAALEARVARLEQIVASPGNPERRAASVLPPWQDGRTRSQRYPKFWHDVPVREAVLERHRRMTIAQAVAEIVTEFGPGRAPSKSALQRVWKAMDGRV